MLGVVTPVGEAGGDRRGPRGEGREHDLLRTVAGEDGRCGEQGRGRDDRQGDAAMEGARFAVLRVLKEKKAL